MTLPKEEKNSSSSSSDEDEEKKNKKKENKILKDKNVKENFEESKSFKQKILEFFKLSSNEEESPILQDKNRTIKDIIESKGFICEKHIVKTEDGYNLVVYRVPGDKYCDNPDKLPPVILQHGLFDSSDGWVCNGENHSIPFVLAKNKFDVWISNSRGNKYCKSHDKYDDKSFEFWQYSFHELGLYDIPAVINYIKKINKSGEKIIYFGHSQGTTLMFSGLTQKFQFYKDNLKLFVALAPVARLSNIGSTLISFLSTISLHKLIKKIRIYEMGADKERNKSIFNFVDKYASGLTNFFINLLCDIDTKASNDKNSVSVFLNHYPSGSSLKCLIHFAQIINGKKFTYFDYKKEANFALYKQKEPPEYDLSVIKDFPIMIIGGDKDRLADPEDVKWLNKELKNNVIYFDIVPNMGHLSFMCAKDFSRFDKPLNIIMNKYYSTIKHSQ